MPFARYAFCVWLCNGGATGNDVLEEEFGDQRVFARAHQYLSLN
jgi:hypothetical protein